MEKIHKSSLNRQQLTENTEITKRNNVTRLQIAEAVIMKTYNPTINRQDTGMTRTLIKLFSDDRIEQQITNSFHSINRYTKL